MKIEICVLLFVGHILTSANCVQICAEELQENGNQQEAILEEIPGVNASGYCVMDGYTGQILYGKEATAPLSNASTTKILTCILVLETGRLEEEVTFSPKAAIAPKVALEAKAGEQFILRDLLYAMLLESYNDCAVAIAEHIAGSVDSFSEEMNAMAAKIGCTDSYFITPNGLDATKGELWHHASAADLCRIMKYCCFESEKATEFVEMSQTKQYQFQNMQGKLYQVTNQNPFLQTLDGICAGKTGFTNAAGYCYVYACNKENLRYTAAVLGAGWPPNRKIRNADVEKISAKMEEEYEFYQKEVPTHGMIELENGYVQGMGLKTWQTTFHLPVKIEVDDAVMEGLHKKGQDIQTHSYMRQMQYPIAKGQVIGALTYQGENWKREYKIRSETEVEYWTFQKLWKSIFYHYMGWETKTK